MVLVLVSCNFSRSRRVRDFTLRDRDLIRESPLWWIQDPIWDSTWHPIRHPTPHWRC